MRRSLITSLLVGLVACGGDPAERRTTYGDDRPADLETPATLTDGKRYPLIVVLHGYGVSGLFQRAYFGVQALVDADQAFVIAPDGNVDSNGKQFWNADPACCDFDGQNPDDVGYLAQMIDDITAEWPVDGVFLLGHSNGGFMAYRMACEHADKLAAIAPLAGRASSMPAGCTPARPVDVLHIHGTLDEAVPYASAETSVAQWTGKNGCGSELQVGTPLDLDSSVAGAETARGAFAGCPEGGAVELWTMEGSGHVPAMNTTFAPSVFGWFADHL